MHPYMKTTALSLCLVAGLCTPVWASGSASDSGDHVISAPVAPVRYEKLPTAVTVNGKAVTFDQGPVLKDGLLFVPVRAIAEGAGSEVTWDSGIQLVHVHMTDRTIMLRLGHVDAEMHEDGVTYLDRNLVTMSSMPLLVAGRTLVPADALTSVFGFQVRTGADGTLQLSKVAKPVAATPDSTERGTISKVQAGDHARILLSGAAMANGEARLTWASITKETRITVQTKDGTTSGSFSDLKEGARVEVTWAGPILMSYPAMGSAAEILVLP